jgi:two-component system, chemotaxis family, chemotaxis protein CheY
MRAVVVDDSSAMRAYLKMILKKAGFEVEGARDGREGLQALHSGPPPDLVLLDWNMPEMNGFQMLCAMRSDPTFQNTQVMMVTTETELAEMSRALEAGANEYVMKPFTPDVILDKLQILGLVTQAL